MQVPEEAAVAASGLQAGLQASREDQLRDCAPYLWPPALPTATPTATLTHQQWLDWRSVRPLLACGRTTALSTLSLSMLSSLSRARA